MKLTPEEKLTVKAYNDGASAWGREHADLDYWKEEFLTFKKLLPKGKVLEIGCGGGRDAKVLLSMGYDYVGTDIAKEFVKVAKEFVPKGKFLTRSAYDLGFKDNEFNGFWASAVFLHIPKKRMDEALTELKRVIKPDGIGFIAVKQGKGEPIIEEDFAGKGSSKRFWAFYHKPEFDEVLKRNNYEIVSYRKWMKSKRTTWLIYFVKNKK